MVDQRRQARPKEKYAKYPNYSDAAYCHIPQHISLRWYTKRVYCSSAWVRPDHLGFAFLQLKYAKPFSICFASLSWFTVRICPAQLLNELAPSSAILLLQTLPLEQSRPYVGVYSSCIPPQHRSLQN